MPEMYKPIESIPKLTSRVVQADQDRPGRDASLGRKDDVCWFTRPTCGKAFSAEDQYDGGNVAEAALKINLSSPRKRAHNSAGPIADLIRSDGGRADERVDVVGPPIFSIVLQRTPVADGS